MNASILALLAKLANILGVFGTIKTAYKIWRLKKEINTMDTKGILQSKTLWGIVIAILAQVLKQFGITVDEAGLTNDILSLISSGFAVYGRLVAEKQITGLLK